MSYQHGITSTHGNDTPQHGITTGTPTTTLIQYNTIALISSTKITQDDNQTNTVSLHMTATNISQSLLGQHLRNKVIINMAHEPTRYLQTWNRCHGLKRNHGHNQSTMYLSHAQVGVMALLQHQCYFEGQNALIHLVAVAH